ncbi:hypothetical protein L227DRAFT_614025 [Lentinus tigrinus ALCF2SS1-6]|uniref:Uncharacterized protein n=1 Tax=Lentinus tigrinus ALCF2SS1-6 TaxID=1328759 RepID=A0A5C2S194_9APHY|nr:hypothetical protein L227DRAFT_614025 [Lentinus tigrinus ALCF2SS1-6]
METSSGLRVNTSASPDEVLAPLPRPNPQNKHKRSIDEEVNAADDQGLHQGARSVKSLPARGRNSLTIGSSAEYKDVQPVEGGEERDLYAARHKKRRFLDPEILAFVTKLLPPGSSVDGSLLTSQIEMLLAKHGVVLTADADDADTMEDVISEPGSATQESLEEAAIEAELLSQQDSEYVLPVATPEDFQSAQSQYQVSPAENVAISMPRPVEESELPTSVSDQAQDTLSHVLAGATDPQLATRVDNSCITSVQSLADQLAGSVPLASFGYN